MINKVSKEILELMDLVMKCCKALDLGVETVTRLRKEIAELKAALAKARSKADFFIGGKK